MFLVPKTKSVWADIDDLFESFFPVSRTYKNSDVYFYSQKNDNGYEVLAKVPGFTKENLTISISDGVLTISGKRESKEDSELKKRWLEEEFEKKLSLPADANAETITAKLEHGVLSIHVPIKEAAKPKAIEII